MCKINPFNWYKSFIQRNCFVEFTKRLLHVVSYCKKQIHEKVFCHYFQNLGTYCDDIFLEILKTFSGVIKLVWIILYDHFYHIMNTTFITFYSLLSCSTTELTKKLNQWPKLNHVSDHDHEKTHQNWTGVSCALQRFLIKQEVSIRASGPRRLNNILWMIESLLTTSAQSDLSLKVGSDPRSWECKTIFPFLVMPGARSGFPFSHLGVAICKERMPLS